jgi:predicted DNA-binding transcriptional regulator YafY
MATKRYIKQDSTGTYRGKVRSFIEYAHDRQVKEVSKLVIKNSDLLCVLVYERVMSASELITSLRFPKTRVFKDLKELQNCKLVIRTDFELHTLYVINGHYLNFIKTLLRYDELSGS